MATLLIMHVSALFRRAAEFSFLRYFPNRQVRSTPLGQNLGRRGSLGLAGASIAGAALGTGGFAPSDALASARGGRGTQSLVAATRSGKVRGVEQSDGVLVWKGVPYAAPPVGPLRFAPPQQVASWTGVRDATEFGPASLQIPPLPGLPGQSEDSLYLNVWSPSTEGKRPVIVWLYGGAFVAGRSNDPTYDGEHYVRRDCVLVTLNYRLAAFGSLYQPDRPGSGNLRLLDQIAALRWVRDNIAAFGGDPSSVTVMGESAGAMSLGALLGSPQARGLFRRAILQSGGPRPTHTAEFASATREAVMRSLGITDASRLMKVPAADLVDASAQAWDDPHLLEPFPHVIDGVVLPVHPLAAVGGGVDLMIGTCAQESELFMGSPLFAGRFESLARQATGERAWQRILQVYEDTSLPGHTTLNDVISGWFVVMPSVYLAEHAHRAGARVWQYTFDYAGASANGAWHSSDIPFTFGNFGPDDFGTPQLPDPTTARELSSKMIDSFIAFARKGTPSTPALPAWPAFTSRDRACLSFDAEPRLLRDRLASARREAWAGVDPYAVA
ncbi:carboxylesterase family protein [Streptomyces sp. NPDC048106]|uniref:carboxylesterase/lipase family protein n=1 Tax=Streptomyces sp. NPDC048106 TaxID=3155750 RepID=UPI003451FEB4